MTSPSGRPHRSSSLGRPLSRSDPDRQAAVALSIRSSDGLFTPPVWSGQDEKQPLMESPSGVYSSHSTNARHPRRPLVHYVRNEWKTDARYGQAHPTLPDESDCCDCLAVFRLPRVKRAIGVCLLLLVILCFSYSWWLKPQWAELDFLKKSLDSDGKLRYGWYGVNVRPHFTDMTQIAKLDDALLPVTGKNRPKKPEAKRLVFIGDVHGCKNELIKLLDTLSFSPTTDHLILTGDIISKGPDSAGAVELARSLGASCVRGNHEDRVLLAHRDLHAHHVPTPATQSELETAVGGRIFAHEDSKDHELARSLTSEQIDYLNTCPVILKVGTLHGMGEILTVHGGLVPGLALERQDPIHVMTMRTIDHNTHVPSENRTGLAWTKLWNFHQSHRPSQERETVIYGHDSRRGLRIGKFSKGLDTGCVNGGKLTALVVAGGRFSVAQRLYSVRCKNYRSRWSADTLDMLEAEPTRRPF